LRKNNSAQETAQWSRERPEQITQEEKNLLQRAPGKLIVARDELSEIKELLFNCHFSS